MIHGHWIKTYGIDGDYTKMAVRPEEVAAFFDGLAHSGLAGCNVTVPLKESAFAAAEHKEPSAVAVGAANTLWLEGGRLHAANSDTYGFMSHLEVTAPQWRRQRPAGVDPGGRRGCPRHRLRVPGSRRRANAGHEPNAGTRGGAGRILRAAVTTVAWETPQ